ncbi:hypothetical protein ACOMHN_006654 [Nucella lapillus]
MLLCQSRGADCNKSKRYSIATTTNGNNNNNERLMGLWSQRELEELHMFSAQLLGKHRYVASNLASQNTTLHHLENHLQTAAKETVPGVSSGSIRSINTSSSSNSSGGGGGKPTEAHTAALLQQLEQRLNMMKTSREQQQEELGVLRSRLQSQIHTQLQATQPRRLAIVPPLPRCTSTPLALPDCAPATPSTPGDCTATHSASTPRCSSSHPPTPGVADCSLTAVCSPHHPNCSPLSSSTPQCSPHRGTPAMTGCSPHPCHAAPAAVSHHHGGMVGVGGGGSGLVGAPASTKLCLAPSDKHGTEVLSQGQLLLQDILDLTP